MEGLFLSTNQAAQATRVPRKTLVKMIEAGSIPATTTASPGSTRKHWKINFNDLEKIEEEYEKYKTIVANGRAATSIERHRMNERILKLESIVALLCAQLGVTVADDSE